MLLRLERWAFCRNTTEKNTSGKKSTTGEGGAEYESSPHPGSAKFASACRHAHNERSERTYSVASKNRFPHSLRQSGVCVELFAVRGARSTLHHEKNIRTLKMRDINPHLKIQDLKTMGGDFATHCSPRFGNFPFKIFLQN